MRRSGTKAYITFSAGAVIGLGVVGCDNAEPRQAGPSRTGATPSNGTGSPHAIAAPTQPAASSSLPTVPTDPSPTTGSFTLRTADNPALIPGLQASLVSLGPDESTGYYIHFFSRLPSTSADTPPNGVLIGQTAVFKPLRTGEKLEVYLDTPPLSAWRKTDDGYELVVSPVIMPAHPGRVVPKVNLQIERITVSR